MLSSTNTKEEIIKKVQEDWVPGTVHLVDVGHSLNVEHNGESDIILIPQPTDDPNDPLTWSWKRKNIQFAILFYWCFLSAVTTNWSGPVWDYFLTEYNTSYSQLNNTSACGFLFLGIGCLILQPTAMKFGRRGVYLFATVIQTLGNVVGGVSKTIGHLYCSSILTCFAGAPGDSLVQISTTDIFYQHERATRISLLTFSIYSGSFLGPVAAGYIAENEKFGWRWCFWFLTIFFGALCAFQFFFMEDSTFVRFTSASKTEENTLVQVKSKELDVDLVSVLKSHDDDIEANSVKYIKRSFIQRLKVIESVYNDPRPWWKICVRPVITVMFPATVWGGFVYGVQIMWLSLISTTQSEVFSTTPYNFSAIGVGNTNFASLIGSFFGMFWGGTLSDKFVAWKSRKNGGVMEPEFRLWFLLLPAVINSAGLLMYGLGSNAGVKWILPAGFGMAFLGFGMGSGGAIVLTYAIDCYPEMQSECMVLMLFIRNMIGTGFTFAIQPWLDTDGIVKTTWLMFMLSMVFNFSFLIFIQWGKKFRIMTKKSYIKFCDPDTFL
ncbi:hypothetical protein DAMA08_007590 [Martiniozyma asiatica (nom. inval.)]|nr:hypothetical protein DAMA08_007590 [Martiniozyma asiatica]